MINIQIVGNNVKLETVKDLTGCVMEIYYYDFLHACYKNEPDARQEICAFHGLGNAGYSFPLSLVHQTKVKCVLLKNGQVIASRESYIGERHRVRFTRKDKEGCDKVKCVYSLVSTVGLSKKILYYQCPGSQTKINMPEDILPNREVLFTIKNGFVPKFKCDPEFEECIIIE